MANGKFIAYYRVSTAQQGRSGLGLEAQQAAVASYLNGGDWELIGEYQEIETGKGADALEKRPVLREALAACKKSGAVLLIAKLDRLARNVHFVTGMIESGVEFKACDMPNADKAMIQIYAVMAELERDQISARTKAALVAAKARGVVLGKAGASNLRPNVEARQQAADAFAGKLGATLKGLQAQGFSQRQIAEELNRTGVRTARGSSWSLTQVQRVLARLDTK